MALTVATVYTARGDNHDTTYHACLFAGSLTQVGPTPPTTCGRGTPISWASSGQSGVSVAYAEVGATTNPPFAFDDVVDVPINFLETVVSQDVPAGSYIVNAAVYLHTGSTGSRQVACAVTSSLNPSSLDRAVTDLEASAPDSINRATLALTTGLTLDANGAIEVRCGTNRPLGGRSATTAGRTRFART